jgi:hypothetical protein
LAIVTPDVGSAASPASASSVSCGLAMQRSSCSPPAGGC